MKIFKILPLLIICTGLCGCSIIDREKSDVTFVTHDTSSQTDIYQKYYKNFVDSKNSHDTKTLSEEALKLLEEDFTYLGDDMYIQHSNGRRVKVYESKKVKGCYYLNDGQWQNLIFPAYHQYKNIDEHLRAYYENAENCGFYAYNLSSLSSENNSGSEIVHLKNKESALMDFGTHTMFSPLYDDVDIKLENMPLTAKMLVESGIPKRVEIALPVTEYCNQLSEENIENIGKLLDNLGFKLSDYSFFGDILKGGSYSKTDNDLKITVRRNLVADERFKITLVTIER